jgi:hypothetical protein
LEDVLAMDHSTAWDRNVSLYRSLGTHFRTVLLTTWERDEARRWLRTERIRYDLLLDKGASIFDDQRWKLQCVTDVQAMGWPIGLYLDADPFVVKEVLARGITTLLISFRVTRPDWLPSANPPRAWSDLVSFIDEQREADGVRGVDEIEGGGRGGWPGDVRQAHVP